MLLAKFSNLNFILSRTEESEITLISLKHLKSNCLQVSVDPRSKKLGIFAKLSLKIPDPIGGGVNVDRLLF